MWGFPVIITNNQNETRGLQESVFISKAKARCGLIRVEIVKLKGQHLLGTSVVTLILLPLAFSCGHDKQQISADYDNIIRAQLRHVVDSIERLNTNCTVRNVRISKEPLNKQNDVHKKMCKITRKLFERESVIENGQLKDAFNKLVGDTNGSLGCSCHPKNESPPRKKRKWKLCKVKNILADLQTYFEQYNAFPPSNAERGKT